MNLKSKQINSIIPGKPNSIEVNGDVTFALRQYKKMQKQSNVIVELYERKFFAKKSDVRRKEVEIARYKQSRESNSEL